MSSMYARSALALIVAGAGCGGGAVAGAGVAPILPRSAAPVAIESESEGVAVARPTCNGSDESVQIDTALERDAAQAGPWNVGWGIAFATAAVGQAAVAVAASDSISDNQRIGLWIGAGKASIGALVRVVRPLHIEPAPECADAETQRRALEVAARRERNNLALNLIGGFALNTAGLLYMGIERDAWREGALSFAVGTAVGLVSAYTAPRRSWLLRRRLDRSETPPPAPQLAPIVTREMRGMAVGWAW